MLRKPALVLIISLSILLTQVRPASADNSYINFYRYITSVYSYFKFSQENTFPKLASSIFYIKEMNQVTDEGEEKPDNPQVAAANITVTTISSPSPTKIPTQVIENDTKPILTPNPTATPKPVQSDTSSPVGYIMNEINNYRRSHGLSEVRNDSYTCDFARVRAQEISSNFSHEGFQNRLNSKTLPYPSYAEVSENIAMHTDYKAIVSMWIGSSGHELNLRKNTPYVCVAQHGNYFAYEGWRR